MQQKNQLQVMLQLQDTMNSKVHSNWREQEFAWFRALWIECGELIDHYGYKWWKKQTPDMQQVQLEVVDIWHFGLSMLIDGRDFAVIAEEIAVEMAQPIAKLGVIEAAEQLVLAVLANKQFSVPAFMALLQASEMRFETLFKQYVGKNVLNLFRQDHGYKDGSYVKIWHGLEDNEQLSKILNDKQQVSSDFAHEVYQALQAIYQTVA
jgi:dimeric dUTPase (all-alpha-NTP-PPase superfamily)